MKYILIFLLLVFSPSYSFGLMPTAKVTVKVIDKRGEPIEGAKIRSFFKTPKGYGEGAGFYGHIITGKTDKDGLFTSKRKTAGSYGVEADMKGFYRSYKKLLFKNIENYLFYKRWIPWNPTIEVVLREKRNPVKMYSKDTDYLKIPHFEVLLGYDLIKGDWVVPYGKGIRKDFIFKFSHDYKSLDDWKGKYTLTFSNEGDGIMEYKASSKLDSVFRWPYEAPESGYKIKKLEKYKKYLIDDDPRTKSVFGNIKKSQYYIFRVRTVLDADGNVKSGMYGMMTKDPIITRLGNVRFSYKLNPKGRSLEYDGNLFDKD